MDDISRTPGRVCQLLIMLLGFGLGKHHVEYHQLCPGMTHVIHECGVYVPRPGPPPHELSHVLDAAIVDLDEHDIRGCGLLIAQKSKAVIDSSGFDDLKEGEVGCGSANAETENRQEKESEKLGNSFWQCHAPLF